MKKINSLILLIILLLTAACSSKNNVDDEGIIVAFFYGWSNCDLTYIDPEIGVVKTTPLSRHANGLSYLPQKQLFVYASGGSLFLYDIVSDQESELFQTHPMPSSPVWSPDGKQIAFAKIYDQNVDLFIYDVDTKEISSLAKNSQFYMFPQDWSKDNKQILLRSGILSEENEYGNFVTLFSTDKKTKNDIYQFPETSFAHFLQFSPDEKIILMGIAQPSDITLFDIEKKQRIELPNIPKESTSPVWSPDGEKIAYIHDNKIFTYTLNTGEITQLEVPEDNYSILLWIEKP